MTMIQNIEFLLLVIISLSLFIITMSLSFKMRKLKKETNKRIKTLEREVRFDFLTDALSRKAFIEEMESSLAVKGEGTLIIFDINGFKSVNTMYGHLAGDGLIKRYSQKLLKEFDKEFVGRLEGDEFMVFIPGSCSREEINSRIKCSGAAKFADKPTKLQITSCCGAAQAPKNGMKFDDLYEKADKALCHSKSNDNTISYYN